MKRYKFLSIFSLVLLLMSSCNDFIELSPYDGILDTEYWQNEEQIRIYSYSFYSAYFVGYGATGLIGGSKFGNGDTFNDDIAWRTQGEFTPIRVPDTDSGWDFSYVRKINYMLEKVQTVPDLSDEALKQGLKKAVWHARIEVVREGQNGLYLSIPHDKVLVLDGSHNPHGAKTLANWLDEYCRGKRVALVLGILKDKDYRGIVETLLPRAKEVICITPPSPRALDKDELLKVVEDVKKEQRKQVKTTTNEDIKQAVQTALNGDAEMVVLCGSLTLFSALV